MAFLGKLAARALLNAVALVVIKTYFSDFQLAGGVEIIIVAAVVLTVLNVTLRPILSLLTKPLLWVTFGLFGLILNMLILWIADQLLTPLTITNLSTLFWSSIIISLANSFF